MRSLNPAQLLVHLFGETSKKSNCKAETARKLEISRQNLEMWLRPRKLMEPGTIPAAKHKDVLTKAREFNIALSAEDLIYGRTLE